MELSRIAELVGELPTKEKMAILELMDLKSGTDMKEIIAHLDKLENKIDIKFEQVERVTSSKHNVLIGMMSFLEIVITVVSILVSLKG